MKVSELMEKYGDWGEHPDYPRDNWKYEVVNDDTQLGYWRWVQNNLVINQEEEEEEK
jgi:hypothetical protein